VHGAELRAQAQGDTQFHVDPRVHEFGRSACKRASPAIPPDRRGQGAAVALHFRLAPERGRGMH